ncbi:MAG TPA: TIGR03915 family putative DNA repair protein [Mobilitalea sp.]|nr:TIGR03915 family putative DNA repair protein [Mobilitalea sp.]
MNTKKIFQCDNSIDGIFTAVYEAWSSGYGHDNVMIEELCEKNDYSNMQLFSEYVTVKTDLNKALKVSRSIKQKISEEAFEIVCRVALSDYRQKGDLIYRFLILGFHLGRDVVNHLSNDVVNQMLKINRNVGNEVHHFLGFLRFSQLDNNVLVSVIHPKNNILSLLAPHFADRLPQEKFIIFDGGRNLCVLHVPGRPWIISDIPETGSDIVKELENNDIYKELWKTFFENIAIKERTNLKLQRNNLPLRYRNDMTEFQS